MSSTSDPTAAAAVTADSTVGAADDHGLSADVPIDPLMELLHWKHTVCSPDFSEAERDVALQSILKAIRQHHMLPYLQFHSVLFDVYFTSEEKSAMQAVIDAALLKFDATIKDAQENLGETEVREAMVAKCDFYARIGDLENAIKQNEACHGKTLGHGLRVDLGFQRIRLGLAFSDTAVLKKALDDCTALIKNADWERRNRFKVYEGVCCVSVRNFERGAKLLLEALATFAATELLSMKDFVFYTATAALVQLDRAQLKRQIVESPEVISAQIPELDALLTSVFRCRYADFFPACERVCHTMLRSVLMAAHVNYFFREARILAFNQFLESYSSVTLASMSTAFAIPEPVLDSMLYTLISNERLQCKVDKVSGRVVTQRGEGNANVEFHKIIKSGDLLLSRLQKLSRVVEL